MGTGISLLIEFPETAVLFVNQVDEYNTACSNYRHTCEYHQCHRPSDTDRDGCSTGKHGEEVEHASDFLSSSSLISKRIRIELR